MEAEIDIDALIDSIDILEYLSQFADFEERNGEYWALSPLKDEKTPSFSVRRETNSFYDFSSGVGGTVITFVRRYYNCSFGEAVKKLAEYAGMTGAAVPHKRFEITGVAGRYKRRPKAHKPSKTAALPDDYMQRYENRPEKLDIWRAEGISDETLELFQVRYDGFSDRIVYPIRSPEGKIVNVGGRALDPRWKEKKLRKYTYFFPWGEMSTLYGLAENRESILEKREIVIFEGVKSVLLAASWGIRNTGALLTSHLNVNQLRLLVKLGCRTVFALDKDVRVRDDRNIERLKQFVTVEYIWDGWNLLDEKDSPVDKGEETFKTLYERRLRYR